jgi:hypothetical protein
MSVSPFESPESSLDKDAKLFTKEEDDLGQTIELPQEEEPTRPPVELKPPTHWPMLCFLEWQQTSSYDHKRQAY